MESPIKKRRTAIFNRNTNILKLIGLWNAGKNQDELAVIFGCNQSTISRNVKLHCDDAI